MNLHSGYHLRMPNSPLIAVPHWRAPTWERTKFYYEALEAAGARYAIVDSDELPRDASGLLLTGGVDVAPRLYGERRSPLTDRPNHKRDEHELRLLRQALDRDIAILCICRGHELLNVAMGGSLLQHIQSDGHRWHDDGSSNWHEITIDSHGRLASLYGGAVALRVNSRHHQGVTEDRLASLLRATARSPDGFVEAMESVQHRWVTGIQWHPERPEMGQDARGLWATFVDAASK